MLSRLPVIIGIGEVKDHPEDPTLWLEPLALMSEALRRAERDTGADCIAKLDSLDIVHQVSWRYEKTAQRLCERLNIHPPRAVYGVTGGESPMRYLHEAALRIARGESDCAAIVGGEAQYAVNKAKSLGIELPWTPIAKEVENPFPVAGRLNPIALAHGAIRPIHVYPFYENASHAAWQQSPGEALAESGDLWSRLSAVAARNPFSWLTRKLSAGEIATPTAENRMICFPYTKHMVANPAVNQGAAIIVSSLERARALGIDVSRCIFIWGGASANEPRDYLQRDQYSHSDAQNVVLNSAQKLAEADGATPALELYSCFPCVPKMTRRLLGLSADVVPTVTGGLSFFGAPLNNYMTHATCAMVRHIREGNAQSGLLYGQGEFITKHHAVVVGREPSRNEIEQHYNLQDAVDARRAPVPAVLENYTGASKVETHTVIYDRDGAPLNGVIVARTASGDRVMARIKGSDKLGIAILENRERSPIGLDGKIDFHDGLLYWT